MKRLMIWALLSVVGPLAEAQTLAEVVSSVQERRRVVKQRELMRKYTQDLHELEAGKTLNDLQLPPGGYTLDNNEPLLAAWNGVGAYPSNSHYEVIDLSLSECVTLLNLASREFDKIKGEYLNISETRLTTLSGATGEGGGPADPVNFGAVRPYTEYDLPSLGLVTPENYRAKLQELAIKVNSLRVIGWPSAMEMMTRRYHGEFVQTQTEFSIPASDGTEIDTFEGSILARRDTETAGTRPENAYTATSANGEWWHSAGISAKHEENHGPPTTPPDPPVPDYETTTYEEDPPPDDIPIPLNSFDLSHSIATKLLFAESVPGDTPLSSATVAETSDQVVGGRSYVLVKRRYNPITGDGFSFERDDLNYTDHSVRLFADDSGQVLTINTTLAQALGDNGFVNLWDFPTFTVTGEYESSNSNNKFQPFGLSFQEYNLIKGYSDLYVPRDPDSGVDWVIYQHDFQLLFVPTFKKGLNKTIGEGGQSAGSSSSEIVKRIGELPSGPVDPMVRTFPDPGVLFSIPVGPGFEGGASGAIGILHPGLTKRSEGGKGWDQVKQADTTPDSFDSKGNICITNSGPSERPLNPPGKSAPAGLDSVLPGMGGEIRFLGSQEEFLVVYETLEESAARWALFAGGTELATHRDELQTYEPHHEIYPLDWIRAWERPLLKQVVGQKIIVNFEHTPETFTTIIEVYHRDPSQDVPTAAEVNDQTGALINQFTISPVNEDGENGEGLTGEGIPDMLFSFKIKDGVDTEDGVDNTPESERARWDFISVENGGPGGGHDFKEYKATISKGDGEAVEVVVKSNTDAGALRVEQLTKEGDKVVSDLHLVKGQAGDSKEVFELLAPEFPVYETSDGARGGTNGDLLTKVTYVPDSRYPSKITVSTPGYPDNVSEWHSSGGEPTGVPKKMSNGEWAVVYSDGADDSLVASYQFEDLEYRKVETTWTKQGSVIHVKDGSRGGLASTGSEELWRSSTTRFAMEGEGSDIAPWGLTSIEPEGPYGTTVTYGSLGENGGLKVTTESGLMSNGSVTNGSKNVTEINHFGSVRSSRDYSRGTLVSGFDGENLNLWGIPTTINPLYPVGLGDSQIDYSSTRPFVSGTTSPLGVGYSVDSRDVLGRVDNFTWNGMSGTKDYTFTDDEGNKKSGLKTKLEEGPGKNHISETAVDLVGRITKSKVSGIHDLSKTYGYVGGNITVASENSTTQANSESTIAAATGVATSIDGNTSLSTDHDLDVDGGLLKKTVTLETGADQVVWTDGWGRVIKTQTPSAAGGNEIVEFEYSDPADAVSKVIIKEMAQLPENQQRWTVQITNPFCDPTDYNQPGASHVTAYGLDFDHNRELATADDDRFTFSSTSVGASNIETIVKETAQDGSLVERYHRIEAISDGQVFQVYNEGEEIVTTTVIFNNGGGNNVASTVYVGSSKGWTSIQEFDKLGNLLSSNGSGNGVPVTKKTYERSPSTGQLSAVNSKVGESQSRVEIDQDLTIKSFTDPIRGLVTVEHNWDTPGKETLEFQGRKIVNKFDGTESEYTGIGVDTKITKKILPGGTETKIEAVGSNQVTKVNAGKSGFPTYKLYTAGPGTLRTWLPGNRLGSITLARGGPAITIDYTTDGAIEPYQVNFPAIGYAPSVTEKFYMGQDGNPETIEDQAGDQTLTWEKDRLKKVIYAGSGPLSGYTVESTIIGGHRTAVEVVRNGQTVYSTNFIRDGQSGELMGHSGLGMNATYQRDQSTRLPISSNRNGIIAYTPRDASVNGRLTSVHSNVAGAPRFRYTQFDGEGLRKVCQTNRGTWTYHYDGDHQLVAASATPSAQYRLPSFVYQVDEMGRRDDFSPAWANATAYSLNQVGGQDHDSLLKLRLQAAANTVFYYSDDQTSELMLEVTPAGAGGLYSMTDNGDGTFDLHVNAAELPNGGWKNWEIKGVLPLEGDDHPLAFDDAVSIRSGVAWISPEDGQYQHDADGNRIQAPGWDYTFDTRNRLVAAKSSGFDGGNGHSLEFKYDSSGRRVEKSVVTKVAGNTTGNTKTEFVWDGWNLIYECQRDNSDNILLERSYLWGLDIGGSYGGARGAGGAGGLLAMEVKEAGTATQTYFPLYDGTGNLVALVDGAKNIVAEYWYGPFGELIEASGPLAASNPIRFATKYYDSETKLSYFGLRYYDSVTGNWLSREPLGERESMNLYAYCHGDPVNKVDILGLLPWREGLGDQNRTPYSVYRGLGLDPLAYNGASPEAQLASKVNLHVATLANDWHDFTSPSFEITPGMSPLEFYSGFEAHRDRAQNIANLQARFHGHSSVGLAYGIANGHPLQSIHRRGTEAYTPLYSSAYAAGGIEGVRHMDTAVSLSATAVVTGVYMTPYGTYAVVNEIEAGTMSAGEGAFWLGLEALPFAAGLIKGGVRGNRALASVVEASFDYAPGYSNGLANRAMRRQFQNELRALGVETRFTTSGGSFFSPGQKVVYLDKSTATPGTLLDEFTHAFNSVHGKGRYLPDELAAFHKSLADEVKRLGNTNRLGREMNMLYHQLELKNFLSSGAQVPGFMRAIPGSDLMRFLDTPAGGIKVGY